VAIENKTKHIYGLQYHPEVQHSEKGIVTLKRFLFDIAHIPADWRIENVLEEEMEKIRQVVGPWNFLNRCIWAQHCPSAL
jgi:GMP synthase (glutamine-hydrolysing)